MTLDAYSSCPGGTGKKIKFCCSDIIPELAKIDRMLTGDQRLACLDYVEKLNQKFPDRACLLVTKASLERATGKVEAANQTLQGMIEQQGANPVALAQSASLAAQQQNLRAAIDYLQHALEASPDALPPAILEAITVVSLALVVSNILHAGRAHLILLASIQPENHEALGLLMRLDQSGSASLLIKDLEVRTAPAGAAPSDEFDEAVRMSDRGLWRLAAERFQELTSDPSLAAPAWRNAAVLLGYLDEAADAAAAWRKYATFDVSDDDAIEAEAIAQLLDDQITDADEEYVRVEYIVRDTDRAYEALAASPQAVAVAVNRPEGDEDGPPPKATFQLLDRRLPEASADLKLNALPRALGLAALYGKQTDRPARLELVSFLERQCNEAIALIGSVAGEWLESPSQPQVLIAASRAERIFEPDWVMPSGTPSDQFQEMLVAHQHWAMLEAWPTIPRKVLDGKTPAEAAADPAYRRRVLALILNMEAAHPAGDQRATADDLRAKLGLPTAAPIDLDTIPPDEVPLVRLARVDVTKTSTEQLSRLHMRALVGGNVAALRKTAQELIARATPENQIDKADLYGLLANHEPDSREALRFINLAREAAEAAKKSSGPWDLAELGIRLERQEQEEIGRLLQHISKEHINEPDVRPRFVQLLQELGLIGPNGALRGMPAEEMEPAGVESSIEAGKIWTPESARGGEKSALWLPGS